MNLNRTSVAELYLTETMNPVPVSLILLEYLLSTMILFKTDKNFIN